MKKLCMTVMILVALVLFAGCVSGNPNLGARTVRGRGSMETHTIRATDFTGISISGGYELTVRQSNNTSVSMYIQSNLFEYVQAEVRGGILYISSTRNFNTGSRNTPRLYVNVPDLNSLSVQGAVDADIELDVTALDISVSGAASVGLSGSAENFNLTVAGAASLEAFDFKAEHVVVSMSGAGEADVYASQTLDVSIAGVGVVRYDGDATVTRSIAGLGTIRRR